MAFIAPIHKPSGVKHGLKLKFFEPEEDCLILAKSNRIEFHELTRTGLELRQSTALYGRVTALAKLEVQNESTEQLLVATSQLTYFTLSWDPKSKKVKLAQGPVHIKHADPTPSGPADICILDPKREILAFTFVQGIFTLIPIVSAKQKLRKLKGTLEEPVSSRVPEILVKSTAFLYGMPDPTIAIIWEDSDGRLNVNAKAIVKGQDIGSLEMKNTEMTITGLEVGSACLIPVPETEGGLIVLCETKILYQDIRNRRVELVLEEPAVFSAWTMIDKPRYLLSDDHGGLYILHINFEGTRSRVSHLEIVTLIVSKPILPKIPFALSPASVLVYLDNGFVFLGSDLGDSLVVRLTDDGQTVDVIQAFPSLAPILDFQIMDLGRGTGERVNAFDSGQARLVTGSGAFEMGTLRSVRSGVGLEDLGILGEMTGIRSISRLALNPSSDFDDVLLVSFAEETRIFYFGEEGEVEEVEKYKGLIPDQETLLAASFSSEQFVQVTDSVVQVVDKESGTVTSQWLSPAGAKSITAAASNTEFLALCVHGTHLYTFNLRNDLEVLSPRVFTKGQEITCIHIPPFRSQICAVGFWDGGVAILQLETLELEYTEVIDPENGASPRALLFAQLLENESPTLLVSMADGVVVTFAFDVDTSTLSDRRTTILGTEPARLQLLPYKSGLDHVLATCDLPSLIYGEEGRIIYSAITAESALCVCPFNAESYPQSVVIATKEDLKIALIDSKRKTHVQTTPFGQMVRRIAHSSRDSSFALGIVSRIVENSEESYPSQVKLVDGVTFETLDVCDLDVEELIECVVNCSVEKVLLNGNTEVIECVLVGIGSVDKVKKGGRIIAFKTTPDRKLARIAQVSVKGTCRCLCTYRGRVVAALDRSVVIYRLHDEHPEGTLEKLASYRTSNLPISLVVTPSLIGVTDIMKSMSLLCYEPGKDGEPDKLTEVARHFEALWSTAATYVGDDSYLESDDQGNLVILRQNKAGVTADDRRRLEVTSEFNLGEMVNIMRSFEVNASPEDSKSPISPRAFLGTAEGSIYLFGFIQPSMTNFLITLQSLMAEKVQTLGDLEFNKYRAFRTKVRQEEEPRRFVDGEFLETFLNLSRAQQKELVEVLDKDLDAVIAIIESLRRLH